MCYIFFSQELITIGFRIKINRLLRIFNRIVRRDTMDKIGTLDAWESVR